MRFSANRRAGASTLPTSRRRPLDHDGTSEEQPRTCIRLVRQRSRGPYPVRRLSSIRSAGGCRRLPRLSSRNGPGHTPEPRASGASQCQSVAFASVQTLNRWTEKPVVGRSPRTGGGPRRRSRGAWTPPPTPQRSSRSLELGTSGRVRSRIPAGARRRRGVGSARRAEPDRAGRDSLDRLDGGRAGAGHRLRALRPPAGAVAERPASGSDLNHDHGLSRSHCGV